MLKNALRVDTPQLANVWEASKTAAPVPSSASAPRVCPDHHLPSPILLTPNRKPRTPRHARGWKRNRPARGRAVQSGFLPACTAVQRRVTFAVVWMGIPVWGSQTSRKTPL
jgi:hypothetical protein